MYILLKSSISRCAISQIRNCQTAAGNSGRELTKSGD